MALSGGREPAGADREPRLLHTHPLAHLAWTGAGRAAGNGVLEGCTQFSGLRGGRVGVGATVRQVTCAWELGRHHLCVPLWGPAGVQSWVGLLSYQSAQAAGKRGRALWSENRAPLP